VIPRKGLTLAQRFERLVDRSGDCHLWIGRKNPDGYGVMTPKRVKKLAHRIGWTIGSGPIPPNMMVLHKCRNRNCVRLDHLYLGTNSDNQRDAVRDGTQSALVRWRLKKLAMLGEK